MCKCSTTSLSFRVKLKAFSKFENTAEALSAATAIVDGKLSKGMRGLFFLIRILFFFFFFFLFAGLKTFLKDELASKDVKDTLAVAETKLGGLIKEKLGIQCVYDNAVNELFRGIRGQLTNLLTGTQALPALRNVYLTPCDFHLQACPRAR